MPDDTYPPATRRRFLGAGATLALTGIGGCAEKLEGGFNPPDLTSDNNRNSNRDDRTPDDSTNNGDEPDEPAAYFYSDRLQATYDTRVLPNYNGGNFNLESTPRDYRYHPDTSTFDTHLDSGTLTLTFDGLITRPVTLLAHFVSPGWDDNHTTESFVTDSPRVREEPLTPATQDYDSPEKNIRTHEITFDVSDINFPTDVSVHAHIILEDHESNTPFTLLHHHTAINLQYRLNNSSRTHWRNTDKIKHFFSDPETAGVTDVYRAVGRAASHWDSFREDGHKVLYYCCKANGELWAASYTINTNEMQNYGRNGDTGDRHVVEASTTAHNDPEMQRFAHQIHASQTRVGVTDIVDRLHQIIIAIQRFTYSSYADNNRIKEGARRYDYCLYKERGNCSEKTAIFGAILRCDAFEIRLAYIDCTIPQGRHLVGGVEATALQNTNHNRNAFRTFNPEDYPDSPSGVPDTEYVFIELTNRGPLLGDYDDDTYTINEFATTNRGEGRPDWW